MPKSLKNKIKQTCLKDTVSLDLVLVAFGGFGGLGGLGGFGGFGGTCLES